MKTKHIIIGLVVVFTSIAIFAQCKDKTETSNKEDCSEPCTKDTKEVIMGENENIIYYTCPMPSHKHIHSSTLGKCSECNMELVAAVVSDEKDKEFYGCPMEAHSHVRQEKPGKCDECGMKLKPMRLVK
ncbi:hypothetical protein KAJ27_12935 [bacterium]|nr:hypothetical protein [bacterium]